MEFKLAQYSIKQIESEKYSDAYMTVDPKRKTFYFNSPTDIGKYTKKALKNFFTREGFKQRRAK